MSFAKRFQDSLGSLYSPAENSQYVVAYSGGLDSHVLLHCFKQLNVAMRAVHVHHGLQVIADDWVEHCQQTCNQLGVQLDTLYVDAQAKAGTSPEEAARNARYQALHENLKKGECLVTAQHKDDQAETLLLQLFRTASTAGLSAMPANKTFGDHMHIRPLLSFSRQEIEVYARENSLQWVEDPSNQDTSYDRNFLRKDILPLLQRRWPGVSSQLAMVAELQSNNLRVLEDMAAIDLANTISTAQTQSKAFVYDLISSLSISRLRQLSSSRLLNLLRYWIISTLDQQPTRNLLHEIERTLINSQRDANPEVAFYDFVFRRFQGDIYLLRKSNARELQYEIEWNPGSPISIERPDIRLQVVDSKGGGLKRDLLDKTFTIRSRKGGEKFHPSGRRHSQSLKKLLQEATIPPWERDVIPLVYLGDELIAVAGLWVSKEYSVAEGEDGWMIKVESV
ncbi:MAG: tRNA lysidine(34) synthetase TilS [Gammaproteobacteria bacterium]|nr:tRNA lysidine(34) synthetase TilS [Gammaproteobacteria bacterium]NNJ49646.1 tRNA lysidine(34) synthetase TilS [Gammaproteobacteria bacterium]